MAVALRTSHKGSSGRNSSVFRLQWRSPAPAHGSIGVPGEEYMGSLFFLTTACESISISKEKSLKIYRTGTSNPNYSNVISKGEAKGTDPTPVHYSKARKIGSKEQQRGSKCEKKFRGWT